MSSTQSQTQSQSDMINKIVDNVISNRALIVEDDCVTLSNSISENTTTTTTTTAAPTSSLSSEMDRTTRRSKTMMVHIPSIATPSNQKLDNNTSPPRPVLEVFVPPFVPMVS